MVRKHGIIIKYPTSQHVSKNTTAASMVSLVFHCLGYTYCNRKIIILFFNFIQVTDTTLKLNPANNKQFCFIRITFLT